MHAKPGFGLFLVAFSGRLWYLESRSTLPLENSSAHFRNACPTPPQPHCAQQNAHRHTLARQPATSVVTPMFYPSTLSLSNHEIAA